MIIFDINTKKLEIPVGLGNLEVKVVSGGTGSAGVNSLNGRQGDLNLKTVNGNDLLGSGNIEISGGISSGDVQTMISSALTDYSTTAVTAELSAATSGIAVDLQALSAYTETISGATGPQGPQGEQGPKGDKGDKGDTGEVDYSRLSAYTTTAVTAELSAATSGIAVELETLSAYTAGISSNDAVYDYEEVIGMESAEKIETWNAIAQAKADGKQVWFRRILGTQVFWYLMSQGAETSGTHRFYAFTPSVVYTLEFFYTGSNAEIVITTSPVIPTATSSVLGGVKVGSGLTVDSSGVLSTQNMVSSTSINQIWTGTQAQYDAITTKDPNTLYIVQ